MSLVPLVEPSQGQTMGLQLVNSERVNIPGAYDLVELAQEIQKADDFVKATASSKLQVIAEQVRFLQEQARKVLEEAKESADLHHVACNIKKIPGKLYYLYRRPTGQRYLSIISPQEWGANGPHEYLGTFRLEHDQSWTPEAKLEKRSQELRMIDNIISQHQSYSTLSIDQFTASNPSHLPQLRGPCQ